MALSELLDSLNPAQREAVTAPSSSHLLVLAGAGSGKTRVLVSRIAWLLEAQDVSPYSILAVTFTNKAANEMRGRIEGMVNLPVSAMWVGTFHSLAHRLLRAHYADANLPKDFQILDSDDQLRVVKRILSSMGLPEDKWAPRQAVNFINSKKDAGVRPEQLKNAYDNYTRTLARVYQEYEETCQRGGMVDFAEILLRAYELWQQHPEILTHYQQRFSHILVDEFQDTNAIQYGWIKALIGANNHLMIVGDDDQSIYGWRGAKIENIQRFSQDFPDSRVLRLEQNYRSTGNILAAANELIANNDGRLGKNLWTQDGMGDLIHIYAAYNDMDEARFIVDQIQNWHKSGRKRNEAAILYRSNAQSRILEEMLIQAGMPYRIYGGLRFFDRAEIKDALAYLRLISNQNDDAAFERIINVPTRGIGETTLQAVRDHARSQVTSMWQAMLDIINSDQLSARARQALQRFHSLIEELVVANRQLSLHELLAQVLHDTALTQFHQKDGGEKALARVENLQELINAAREYTPPSDSMTSALHEFLANAALEGGEHQAQNYDDCVQLMTLHAAKGLEFPLVFLAGIEEGLFPHPMSLEETGRLEEERRLCYVGMTRAMSKLFISYAEVRRIHGKELHHRPSRFIREIPEQYLHQVRIKAKINPSYHFTAQTARAKPSYVPTEVYPGLNMGQRVMHPVFGEGVILDQEGYGEQARVHVRFQKVGAKWLLANLAKLQPLN